MFDVLAGVAIGLAGAAALTRVLKAQLYGVTATDPLTFVAVPAMLLAVAWIAAYIPARRAMQIDPMAALRSE
jgi:ABC-type lipoprotein release transport system permease subunit